MHIVSQLTKGFYHLTPFYIDSEVIVDTHLTGCVHTHPPTHWHKRAHTRARAPTHALTHTWHRRAALRSHRRPGRRRPPSRRCPAAPQWSRSAREFRMQCDWSMENVLHEPNEHKPSHQLCANLPKLLVLHPLRAEVEADLPQVRACFEEPLGVGLLGGHHDPAARRRIGFGKWRSRWDSLANQQSSSWLFGKAVKVSAVSPSCRTQCAIWKQKFVNLENHAIKICTRTYREFNI